MHEADESPVANANPAQWPSLKGTGFSPYIKLTQINWALAPEGMHSQSDHHPNLGKTIT
jgi:hypothetical protein